MKFINNNKKIFIIAEAGINHNGSVKLAKKMVDVVKASGADCIKFQTFKVEELVSNKSLTYTYKSQGKEITESQYDMFKRCEFTPGEWKKIIAYCKKKGILFSTTAQNLSDLDLILSLTDLPFIKVGSDDLTNLDLMIAYAKKGIPMVISAGMAFAGEIEDAVLAIRNAGNSDVTVLHCIASYPAQADEVNLRKIPIIRECFGVKVGFSDHTIGSTAAIGAVCFGATIIEKHFTLDHDLPGPDHWFSLDPEELKVYVKDIRFVERSLGSSILRPTDKEMAMRPIARRSIVAKTKIPAGQTITSKNIEFKRPGTGISPRFKRLVINQLARKNYEPGDLIE